MDGVNCCLGVITGRVAGVVSTIRAGSQGAGSGKHGTVILYKALIWTAIFFSLYSHAGEYLCYFKFAHSSTQQAGDTQQDIYLMNVILVLS